MSTCVYSSAVTLVYDDYTGSDMTSVTVKTPCDFY